MSYKTELHCHTKEFSLCATQSGVDAVEQYIEAGYDTVVVTNHFNADMPGWEDHAAFTRGFFHAAEIMREAAGDRLNIITGMELRLRENMNDYHVFGLTEEILLEIPDIHDMRIGGFYGIAKELGLIVIQAHPFRIGMTVTEPECLDGIEVYNAANGRSLYSETARFWVEGLASEKKLIMTSGSDHHHEWQEPRGGILTDEPITTNEQLVATLRSGEYTMITF